MSEAIAPVRDDWRTERAQPAAPAPEPPKEEPKPAPDPAPPVDQVNLSSQAHEPDAPPSPHAEAIKVNFSEPAVPRPDPLAGNFEAANYLENGVGERPRHANGVELTDAELEQRKLEYHAAHHNAYVEATLASRGAGTHEEYEQSMQRLAALQGGDRQRAGQIVDQAPLEVGYVDPTAPRYQGGAGAGPGGDGATTPIPDGAVADGGMQGPAPGAGGPPPERDDWRVRPSNGPTQRTIQAAIDRANQTGDLRELDKVDEYRLQLDPSEHAAYDAELEKLRNDPRIAFANRDGSEVSAAEKDRFYRGVLATSYGRPDLREQAIANAVSHKGAMNVTYTDSEFVTPRRRSIGEASHDGQIAISRPSEQRAYAGGDVFSHEFIHTQQTGGPHQAHPVLPSGASAEQTAEFTRLYEAAYKPQPGEEGRKDTMHYYTTAHNDFITKPWEMKAKNPELYDWMVRYQNYDPMTGQRLRCPDPAPAPPARPWWQFWP